MSASNLQISSLAKRYGDFVALAPTNLTVAKGEFLTLLGPSGSGKTTLLSLIAGLGQPDDGAIHINGVDVTYGAPYERDIGMVFQNYALFPHMTVAENVAFPLQMRKTSARDAQAQVKAALEMVHLGHLGQRYPKELSGGQQQRIALARCMVYRPSIILMDEPLGALDKKLRDHMQLEIKRIHRDLGTTIVYVTHDQEEAMTMSDRICLMNAGSIAQLGTPADLYFRPSSVFVADFLGESNLIDAVLETPMLDDDKARVRLADGTSVYAMAYDQTSKVNDKVKLMVRPQNLHVGEPIGSIASMASMASGEGAYAGAGGTISATLSDIMVTGSMTKLYFTPLIAGGNDIVAAFPTQRLARQYEVGQRLSLYWNAADAVIIGG